MFRELTNEEVAFVAGGQLSATVYFSPVDYSSYFSGSGNGGGGGGGYGSNSNQQSDRLQPHEIFKLAGHVCPVDLQAFDAAISDLEYGSATAKAMLDKALKDGYTINLIHTGEHGASDVDHADPINKVIYWDPFAAIQLKSDDRTSSLNQYQAPLIGLVHEIGHVIAGPDAPSYSLYNQDGTVAPYVNAAERDDIQNYETPVVNELNTTYGNLLHNDARTNAGGDTFITDSAEHTTKSNTRPDCTE